MLQGTAKGFKKRIDQILLYLKNCGSDPSVPQRAMGGRHVVQPLNGLSLGLGKEASTPAGAQVDRDALMPTDMSQAQKHKRRVTP